MSPIQPTFRPIAMAAASLLLLSGCGMAARPLAAPAPGAHLAAAAKAPAATLTYDLAAEADQVFVRIGTRLDDHHPIAIAADTAELTFGGKRLGSRRLVPGRDGTLWVRTAGPAAPADPGATYVRIGAWTWTPERATTTVTLDPDVRLEALVSRPSLLPVGRPAFTLKVPTRPAADRPIEPLRPADVPGVAGPF